MIDPTFSESSYGFRPGRRAHDAVCQAQRFVQSGRRWVVDVDLEKFFDRVNPAVLMGLVHKRITDPRLLALIRRYRNAGGMADGVVTDRHEGTPQGGPLSPVLANVLLDVVDKQLEQRGHRFVRYADDGNIYVQSKRAGGRVMHPMITRYATRKLRINVAKSAVAPATDRQFLGCSFWYAKGGQVKRRVAPKALGTMKERIREITSRNGGRSLAKVTAELRSYLTGWKAYCRLADTPGVLADVDKWLPRRVRLLIVKQCKRGTTLFRLVASSGCVRTRGASSGGARSALVGDGGAWRPAYGVSERRHFVAWRTAPRPLITSPHRTAGCGPARPVVWEGSRSGYLSDSLSRSSPKTVRISSHARGRAPGTQRVHGRSLLLSGATARLCGESHALRP